MLGTTLGDVVGIRASIVPKCIFNGVVSHNLHFDGGDLIIFDFGRYLKDTMNDVIYTFSSLIIRILISFVYISL